MEIVKIMEITWNHVFKITEIVKIMEITWNHIYDFELHRFKLNRKARLKVGTFEGLFESNTFVYALIPDQGRKQTGSWNKSQCANHMGHYLGP